MLTQKRQGHLAALSPSLRVRSSAGRATANPRHAGASVNRNGRCHPPLWGQVAPVNDHVCDSEFEPKSNCPTSQLAVSSFIEIRPRQLIPTTFHLTFSASDWRRHEAYSAETAGFGPRTHRPKRESRTGRPNFPALFAPKPSLCSRTKKKLEPYTHYKVHPKDVGANRPCEIKT